MKIFNFHQLGVITLVSTAASLIGLFQIGLINGGYRIIALQNKDSNEKVNNVVFSYLGVLSIIMSIISMIIYCLGYYKDGLIIVTVNVLGLCMLITNWLTNSLIGSAEFNRLNIANSISAFASLLCLFLAYYFGLYGALLSLAIQPLLFMLIVFLSNRKEVPKKFDLDFNYIRYILSFGFIPFLSGIFFLLYMQMERWSIIAFLRPEALGQMYLVFLTTTLWVLVPTSILNLFFPKAIKFYSENDMSNFNRVIKTNTTITLVYCILVSVLILILLKPIVSVIFPKHEPYVFLVFLGLPGLIFRTMSDPISLYLNSIVLLKPIFWSDALAILVYVSCLSSLFLFKKFSLTNFVICFNIYFAFKFFYLLVHYIKLRINEKVGTNF